jgi:leader peptidase (prepilin peptidase)/N-methyltransferase
LFIAVYLGIIVFLSGLLLGSFFNVCIYRIPAGESIITPPSHCPRGGHRLGWSDLVPVLSRTVLKGKCRYCSAPVAFRYTVVELLTAVLLTLLYVRFGLTMQFLLFSVLVCALIVVSFIDYDCRIIPHGPLLFVTGAGLLFAAYSGGVQAVLTALLAALCGGAPLLLMDIAARVFLKKEGMGMGDVKLMAAAGTVLGIRLVLFSLLAAVWACALWIMAMLVYGKLKKGNYIPFGPFLSIGCIISIYFGDEIISWYLKLLS